MQLTSKERIMRIFQNKEIDRPALKLWGAELNTEKLLHPAYKPVAELAASTTDLFGSAPFTFNINAGKNIDRYVENYTTDTEKPDWKDSRRLVLYYHQLIHLLLHVQQQLLTQNADQYLTFLKENQFRAAQFQQ